MTLVNCNNVINMNRKVNRDYKDYKTMFLEEEFIELTDMIMENTFFNII